MKLALQIFLGVLSLVTLFYGVAGLLTGAGPYDVEGPALQLLDNQLRYSAGVYLVFSFLLWWIIPDIERHAMPIRIISAAIMLGGIGRLISLLNAGSGLGAQLVLMSAELAAPGMIFWQANVARQAENKTPDDVSRP